MNSSALIFLDANKLRTAAFSAILEPWACQFGIGFHVIHDPEELAGLPAHEKVTCLYSVGGLSLRDDAVGRTIDRVRDLIPGCSLVVFSDLADSIEIATAIDYELRGFIPTTMNPQVALAAIQFILNGGTYHPLSSGGARPGPAPASAMIRHIDEHRNAKAAASGAASGPSPRWPAPVPAAPHLPAERAAPMDPLTKKRHIEVLEHLARGETNKEIARHLNLTEATIKVYVRELMRHFGAKNRMQVALKASAAYEGSPAGLTLVDCPAEPAPVGALVGTRLR